MSLDKYFKTLLLSLIILSPSIFANEGIGKLEKLFKVSKVEIQGLRKVEREAIIEKISTKKGMTATNYSIRNDIKAIYALNYFENVEAHRKGKKLIFKVVEKPIISSIGFVGNDELDIDELSEKVKVKEFTILDLSALKEDAKALRKFYEEKGFYLASVDVELQNKSKEGVEVVFKVKEYQKVKVKKISFLGNRAFSDNEIQSIMMTKEETLFGFMSGAGNFQEFGFQTDIERIKHFYRIKGYLQINTGAPEITVSEDKKWVFITLRINEGPQFDVNSVTYVGSDLFDDDQLSAKVKTKANETYSEELLRRDIQTLTEMYQDEGYAFANVLRNLRIVPGENKVDVEFSFEKGKKARFGLITVKGNSKTRDKVVRRELKIGEGEIFSGSKLRESRENVNRLGFFEPGSVVFNTVARPNRDDILDVEITVKERNTGQISVGGGYASNQGGFFQASIAQTNFRGLGQNLKFSTSLSSTQTNFNLGFTEPYFMDTLWTAGGDIYHNKNSTSDNFDYKQIGGDVRVGYPIFEYTRLFLTYRWEDTEISNVKDTNIVDEHENGVASSVRLSMIHDKRNNRFETTSGYYFSLATEYAGIGGDKKWFKNEFDARYFKNVVGDLVFKSRFYAGHLTEINKQPIPRTEKYTLGGPKNLRGYSYEAIGQKQTGTVTVDGSPEEREFNAGALYTAHMTFELEHPMAREAGLNWVLFFDVGDATNKYDKFFPFMDYGFGLRWFTPVFGVMRFEFGWPVHEIPGEGKDMQFHLDIGQLF